ncbi:hypothetical protein JHK84_026749 [Glycine max]|uniref:Uncharacterized protein n=2 Tax=Glycine subgen. Soja TaxID=1462606 RepID=C6TG53_SOYBN|nr:uncharacterized protein LOC100812145 [Glycine max]XP_028183024.1 uncharacterized protein LOC114369942 [Glycine soja]XP_040861555.1 uncharacterized protein LOC100812145 isoform X1 [Glycine max]ACU20805.1 unknown [Glycine max]KAG5002496.1 hypothetical protein JHK86_026635 [Glycine max]KAG5150277.1 hypothetical protein JHK84_026749 [Glycine max]KHN10077.1 Dehydrodolichyl diphosphate synthase 6 [Glycine soja]RZB85007.1 hypothetical protein D0Y65_025590 [Glycine soja]|eukprot:NP_001240235.1 uncharacterized protein LOC100812145 [Glycine max]
MRLCMLFKNSVRKKRNEVQVSKEAKLTNDAFARIDLGLKGNGFDLLFQDSCKDYLNATKACSSVPNRVEGAGEKDGMLEHTVEKHSGNNSEAEITSCNEMVEMTEEGEVPFVKLVDIEKNMYMAVAPDPDILIRTSGEAQTQQFSSMAD